MTRKFGLIALLLAGACAPTGAGYTPTQSPKDVSVQVTSESYVVKLNPGGNAVLEGEGQELTRFLASLGDLDDVEFSIRRTHRGLGLGALAPVERELIARGADPEKIVRLAEIGVDYQGNWSDVEIIAKRYIAMAPACPDFSRANIGDNLNMGSSNFGCANQQALAYSVADPRDLARGRQEDPAAGAHSVGAVERYNTDQVKELKDQSTREKE